ncbi:MAG: HAD family phosphatase [Patescibacteria group bacterium]
MQPKLICFDFDDTLTTENSWFNLNTAMGIFPEEDYAMYLEYKNGEVTYKEWTTKIENLYKERGLATREKITQALEQFTLRTDAIETINELQSRGYEIIIISGSFDITIAHASKILDITTFKAGTNIIFTEDGAFSHFVNYGEEDLTKLNQLTEICKQKNIQLSDCVCVGDGANDLELFKATGNGICFTNGSAEVKSAAKYQIENLIDLLTILT